MNFVSRRKAQSPMMEIDSIGIRFGNNGSFALDSQESVIESSRLAVWRTVEKHYEFLGQAISAS